MEIDDKNEHEHPVYSFGWWPEIVGLLGVIVVIWYLMTYARGSI